MPLVDPFADLDRAATPEAQQSARVDPFADLDAAQAKAAGPPSSVSSIAEQAPVGLNEGMANAFGAPVDLVNWGLKKLGAPMSDTPIGGSASIKNLMGMVGANPDEHPANTMPERIVRGVGEGAGSVLAPEAALAGGVRAGLATAAPKTVEALQRAFGTADTIPAVIGNAGVGALAGGAGEAATELPVPDRYKPIAGTAGSLIGGLAGAGLASIPTGVRASVSAARNFERPFTESGREQIAAGRLRDATTDVDATKAALDEGTGEIVPGSRPTTFQLTNDPGLGQLERQIATENPEPFVERRLEQGTARADAIRDFSSIGNPATVSKFFGDQLQAIDAEAGTRESDALAHAQTALDALGGQHSPEEIGVMLRTHMQDARTAAKAQERVLWKAVDPDNKLALPAAPIQKAATDITAALPRSAAPMSGEEQAIFDTAKAYPAVQSFNEVTALRSRISAAMRDEMKTYGQSPAYARLAQLRGSVESAISGAVERKAADDMQAVATGQMSPDATAAAYVRGWMNDAITQNAAAAGRRGATGVPSGDDSLGIPAAGATSQAGRKPRGNAGAQGIPGEALPAANFDQAAALRLKTANEATKERVGTYDTGPVGAVLRSAGAQGAYKVPDSAVPSRVFAGGPGGGEAVRAYLKAAGDGPGPALALQDAAANSLRREAMGSDGAIDPARFARWQAKHAEALRETPEIATQFADAANASEALGRVAAARKLARDTYEKGIIGDLIKSDDRTTITRTIGSIFGRKDAADIFRRLKTEIGANRTAKAGLRRAVAEHIADTFLSNADAVKADAFMTFVRHNNDVLKIVLTKPQLDSLRAIAQDLQRSARSANTKAVAGPGTAQDVAATEKGRISHVSLLAKMAGGAGAGFAAHGVSGAVGGGLLALGSHVIGGMREAGLQRVNDLVREAMLNPELARTLLMKAPIKPNIGSAVTLAHQLRRMSVFAPAFGAASGQDDGDRPRRADGGAVPGDDPAAAKQAAVDYASSLPQPSRSSAPTPLPPIPGSTHFVGMDAMPMSGLQRAAQDPANPMIGRIGAALPMAIGHEVAGAARNLADLFTAPGDVYAGRLTPDDPRFADSAIGLGAALTQGGMGAVGTGMGAAEPGAVGIFGSRMVPYPYEWQRSLLRNSSEASFKTDKGNAYNVHIDKDKYTGEAHVSFYDKDYRTAINNTEGPGALRVLNTVVDAVKNKIEADPTIRSVLFMADASEPSRVKLYRAMAGRVGDFTESQSGRDVKFRIPVPRDVPRDINGMEVAHLPAPIERPPRPPYLARTRLRPASDLRE